MKINQKQKNLLRKKITSQKSWFILSKTYQGKVRESYLLLYQSIREHQDDIKNKWQNLIRTIGGKGV